MSALTNFNPAMAKKLQEAQKAWIKYRDANCTFYELIPGRNAVLEESECFLTN
jgi:uncharacterized protein YecT (DUF1311 family)